MFEKFGEMDSYKEINELAENLFNEGDVDSLRAMAKENGIPDDFVEMYLEGMIPELCDLTTAAVGKLDKEAEELKLKGLMLDWVEYIKGLCMQEVMIAHQVRKQGIYRELRKIYFYEDDTYLIRPARSAGEIVREGRLLHHCVGGDNYLGKHNRRESYILMLRFKDKAEEPYITVEISSNNPKIRQWYGTNDRKPDAKNMQKWLNDYLKQLKEKREMLAKTA